MVAAADTSLYDWMMITSVCLGYIDQVTDLLFVLASRRTSYSTSLFAAIFIAFFTLGSVGRAIAYRRGLVGALLALTGTELAVRAWQAYHTHNQDAVQRWKQVADYISMESILEGIPLVFLATVYLFQLEEPCIFLTCDATAIADSFPSYVLTLPAAPPISKADVSSIHAHDPRCSHLPLTSDGWFTFDPRSLNTTFEDRRAAAFERVTELQISGSALQNITGQPSASHSCVGFTARPPGSWSPLLPASISSTTAIPALSILCGILCSAYHLSRMYCTDNPASLWQIPQAHAWNRAADARQASRVAGGVRRASFARVHPDGGKAPRWTRPSVQSLRSVLGVRPQFGPVVVHHAAAFACFAVDVMFIICLWCEVIHATLLAAPHVSLFGVQVVAIVAAAAVKAWLVVGGSGWPWVAAVGQMLWTVPPLRVTNPWTLRVAPRWGRYAAVIVSIAVNGAMLVGVTAAPAAMARGGGYPWRISWGPLLVLWVQFLMHVALMRLAFWTHARALAAPVGEPGVAEDRTIDAQEMAEVELAATVDCGGAVVSLQGDIAPERVARNEVSGEDDQRLSYV